MAGAPVERTRRPRRCASAHRRQARSTHCAPAHRVHAGGGGRTQHGADQRADQDGTMRERAGRRPARRAVDRQADADRARVRRTSRNDGWNRRAAPPAARNMVHVSGDHSARWTGMLITAYTAAIAYDRPQKTRCAAAARTRTPRTPARLPRRATDTRRATTIRQRDCWPADARTLLTTSTISRLTALIAWTRLTRFSSGTETMRLMPRLRQIQSCTTTARAGGAAYTAWRSPT